MQAPDHMRHNLDRRDFFRAAASGTVLAAAAATTARAQTTATPPADREMWIGVLRRLADPVLTNLSRGTLKARMPVEQAAGANRRPSRISRRSAGCSPASRPGSSSPMTRREGRQRAECRARAPRDRPRRRSCVARRAELHPRSPAARRRGVSGAGPAARAARAARRARRDGEAQLIAALESTRVILPGFNNWLLFAATVEAGLQALGASWDRLRVDYALRQHEQWYKGDGAYGDGPDFHWDYYNSFVIQPMLVDVLDACGDENPAWKEMVTRVEQRAHAATRPSRNASSRRTAASRRSAARLRIASAPSTCSRRRRSVMRCPTASRPRRSAAR